MPKASGPRSAAAISRVVSVLISIVIIVFGSLSFYAAFLHNGSINQSRVNSFSTSNSQVTSSCETELLPCQHINEDGALFVSVKYYYYNQNTTQTFTFTAGNQIYIQACCYGSNWNAASNFTVTSSIQSITFGGKDNLSEGALVNYTITPLTGINGTYYFGFGALYPSFEICNAAFLLAIGNGLPNFSPYEGSCSSSLSTLYPVDSHGFVEGYLFAQIIKTSNSTCGGFGCDMSFTTVTLVKPPDNAETKQNVSLKSYIIKKENTFL
jgi:hypothetical protein